MDPSENDVQGQMAELDACLSLGERLGLRKGLPYSRHWSAAADFLQLIVDHALAAKPSTIVECGSGLSTLMLARCCALSGHGRVFSLEHGPEFAAKTRAEIARYELGEFATVIDAPLRLQMVNGQAYQWYALDALAAVTIDMLVIDGPPGFIQPYARYPALPLLFDRFAANGIAFLDDAAREDEREIVARWLAEFSAVRHEYIALARGCSILRLGGTASG